MTTRNMRNDIINFGNIVCPHCTHSHRMRYSPIPDGVEGVDGEDWTHVALCHETDKPLLIRVWSDGVDEPRRPIFDPDRYDPFEQKVLIGLVLTIMAIILLLSYCGGAV